MYLVCRVENQIDWTMQQLNLAKIDADALVLMRCSPNLDVLHNLHSKCTQYDYIFFVSPTCIDICKDIIKSLPESIIYGVMGEASLEHLQHCTSANIISPKKQTGAKALIHECLDFTDLTNKKILILQGDDGDETLIDYFNSIDVKYNTIQVYIREKIEPDLGKLKYEIENETLSGIIITSSLLVEYLFELVEKNGFSKALCNQRFITMHPKIMHKLHTFGVLEVYMAKNMIDLIKGLEENE